ncbi:Serine/threonine-protein kinase STN8 chloroplastic [Bienertia sinuspersici]
MASSLLSPATSAHPKSLSLSSIKPSTPNHVISLIKHPRRINLSCNAFPESTTQVLPPEVRKWGIAAFAGLAWIYLTARPGVLIGAIDAYILAPLQLGFDTLTGKRRLKRSDFLITDKLGEVFGTVYAGVVLPKGVNVEQSVPKRGLSRILESDKRFKDKVNLELQGQRMWRYEEWFNYRLTRAAPDTCAEFLGSFIADKTNSQYVKGGKCLVWKFEGDQDLEDYMKSAAFL